ncbi:MAG: HEAT repeat domain-containing protein [Pirellulales bacterium]
MVRQPVCSGARGKWIQFFCLGFLSGSVLLSTGCVSSWFSRPKDPVEEEKERRKDLRAIYESEERPRLVREVASRPRLTLSRLENIGLLTHLPGTGGKVAPSGQRDNLLDEIRLKDIKNPNQLLDDPSTAMVVVDVLVPPVARKNDRLDVNIKLSAQAQATDLQGGWLLATDLMEMNLLAGSVRKGFPNARAGGPLVTKAQIFGQVKPEDALSGVIVGGGELLKPRTIGLYIDEEYCDALTMAAVLPAINRRFTVFDGGNNVGVGTPEGDSYVDLKVPVKYQADPFHFASVIQNLGILESQDDQKKRMEICRAQLCEPTTARLAACQLEAIGKEAVPALVEGSKHPNKEVRFYSAHSLGYLNDLRAVKPLAELAETEPAFRAMCFNALAIIERFEARDALEELLHKGDAEVRYGAVRALRARDPGSLVVSGEQVGETGKILSISSPGAPLVAVSLSQVPEVVIFGESPKVQLPVFMYVNPRLMLRVKGPDRISISHLAPDKEDRLTECNADLHSLLAAMAEVGAGYGDWVSLLRQLKEGNHIAAEVAMNPIPISGRKFERNESELEPGDKILEGSVADAPAVAPPRELIEANKERAVWYNPKTWFTP